jgi:heat shock protein HtpX
MFTWIKRIGFFVLTNIAVMIVVTVAMKAIEFFFPGLVTQYQSITHLAILSVVIGFSGSCISLFLSKWSAKSMYGIELLDQYTAQKDIKLQRVWDTVVRISQQEGIKMPEVGYYTSPEANAFATGATKNSALVAVST